jgi:hypothetical protein
LVGAEAWTDSRLRGRVRLRVTSLQPREGFHRSTVFHRPHRPLHCLAALFASSLPIASSTPTLPRSLCDLSIHGFCKSLQIPYPAFPCLRHTIAHRANRPRLSPSTSSTPPPRPRPAPTSLRRLSPSPTRSSWTSSAPAASKLRECENSPPGHARADWSIRRPRCLRSPADPRSTVFSHASTVVTCNNCQQVLCQPTGGKARLTEGGSQPRVWRAVPLLTHASGCSFRRKN